MLRPLNRCHPAISVAVHLLKFQGYPSLLGIVCVLSKRWQYGPVDVVCQFLETWSLSTRGREMIKQHGHPSFHFIIISPLKVFFFTSIKRSTFIKNFYLFYVFGVCFFLIIGPWVFVMMGKKMEIKWLIASSILYFFACRVIVQKVWISVA